MKLLYIFKIVVKYIIQSLCIFTICNHSSVALSTFTLLWMVVVNQPSLELFNLPKLKLYPLNSHSPSFPPHSPWKPPFYLVSISLTTVCPLYKWNHTVFVLLCLAYFNLALCLQGSSCYSTCQDFFLSKSE